MAIGLTLALLPTALMAALTVLSLHVLGQRLTRLQEASAINRGVLEVRQIEKDFVLHGKKSDTEHLRRRPVVALERMGQLKADGDADQVFGTVEVEQVLAAYLGAFDRFEQSIQGHQLAWGSASWSLNGATNSLDILQPGLAEDGVYTLRENQGRDGRPLLQQAIQVAQVNRLVLQGLDEIRSRLETRAAGAQEGSSESLREALELVVRLEQAIINNAYVSAVRDVLANICGFADKFTEYRASRYQGRQTYAVIGKCAEQVMACTDHSWEAQQQAMLHNLRTSSPLIVGAAVLAPLMGLGVALGISLLIARPLCRVMGVARQITEGDLVVRVNDERCDEVGQLMAAMRAITGSLRGIVSQLQDGVGRVAGASEALSGVIICTRLGIDSQRTETERVAATMNQMAAVTHRVAYNTEETAESAESADSKASVGQEVVCQTLGRAERLAETVRTAAANVKALSADSQYIDGVPDTIKNVVEQTNLPALSTTIEAARVGDQGQGFVVVADKVRALARCTQQSMTEIETLIGVLQNGTQQAVRRMQCSHQLVNRSVDNALQTEAALGDIATTVALIQQMNQQIAAAFEQQSMVAEEINCSVTAIREVADQPVQAIQSTASSSEQLTGPGYELQGMVRRFRLQPWPGRRIFPAGAVSSDGH